MPGVRIVSFGPGLPEAVNARVEVLRSNGPLSSAAWSAVVAGADWTVLHFERESIVGGEAWDSFLQALPGLPSDIAVIEVLREEASASGPRESWTARAVRSGSLSAGVPHPVAPWTTSGRRVQARGVSVTFNRGSASDPVGLAERAESAGDWTLAAGRWEEIGRSCDDSFGAYALVRSAIAVGGLYPRSAEIRTRAMASVARCPLLPEAAVVLAAWWLHQGDPRRALEWAQMAAGIQEPSSDVPQPTGISTWWVPSRLARAFAGVGHEAAARFATAALGLDPPHHVADPLKMIAGR